MPKGQEITTEQLLYLEIIIHHRLSSDLVYSSFL